MGNYTVYFGILTWIIATAFAWGVMWWKVEAARGSVNILFKKVDELKDNVSKHEGELDSVKENLQRLDKNMAGAVIRIDQIYQILTSGK